VDKYELKLGEFRGPLEKLLELIETKELEITQLSLAEVTADFLDYVRGLSEIDPVSSRAPQAPDGHFQRPTTNGVDPVSSRAPQAPDGHFQRPTTNGVDPRVLADFVVVAARLILIKSHAILPQLELSQEEEEDIADLENRLRIYKEFRAVEKHIGETWKKNTAHSRDYLVELPRGFYLTQAVGVGDLRGRMEALYNELQSFIPKVDEERIKLVSLEEKIEEVIARVDKAVRTSFNEIAHGKDKAEIIVLFLALLHLLKESSIYIKQDGLFSEIVINANG